MGHAIWNLFVALINATLILVALCLFLGWKVMDKVDDLTTDFAQNLQIVTPLTEEIQTTRGEIAALRGDLAELRETGVSRDSEAFARLEDRMGNLETRISGIVDTAQSVVQNPADLVDRAVYSAADAAVAGLQRLRGCVPDAAQSAGLSALPPSV